MLPVDLSRAFENTSWVWVTIATSLPSVVVIRVCQTMVRRPRCRGVASPTIRAPTGAAPIKLVLLSIVAVALSSLRFASVPSAPSVSAKAMMAPPCSTAGWVQSSLRTVISPTILSGVALTTSIPRSAAKGSGGSLSRFIGSTILRTDQELGG